jgi:hypothetical protein
MKSLKYYKIKIEVFFRDIKWAIQRARRGYSDGDLYSIKDYVWKTWPLMLRAFAKNTHTHPIDMTHGEWMDILERMAVLCERSNPDYWIDQFPDDDSPNKEEFIDCFRKADKHLDMFCDMLRIYFPNLWD